MNIALWIVVAISGLYILIFIFLQINKKKQMIEHQAHMEDFHKSLKKGDYVVTISGIYGYINSIEGKKVKLKIANEVCVTMDIQSILGVLNK